MNISKIKKLIEKDLEVNQYELATVFSPSNIYQPNEEVILIILRFFINTAELKLVISYEDGFIIEEKILEFSKDGISINKFSEFPIGKFRAELYSSNSKDETDCLDKANFQIIEFSPSWINAKILSRKRLDILKVENIIELKRPDGSLVHEKLIIEYLNISFTIIPENGKIILLTNEIEEFISNSYKTFIIKDDKGNQCELNLNSVSRESIRINSFEKCLKLSKYPESKIKTLGLYHIEDEHERISDFKILSHTYLTQKNKIKIQLPDFDLKNIKFIIFSHDFKLFEILEFINLKPNHIIEIDGFPFATHLGYCFLKNLDIFQNVATIFEQFNIDLKIDNPNSISLGQNISIKINSNLAKECIVILKQKNIQGVDLQSGFIENLQKFIMHSNQKINLIIENIERKSGNTLRRKIIKYLTEVIFYRMRNWIGGILTSIILSPIFLVIFLHRIFEYIYRNSEFFIRYFFRRSNRKKNYYDDQFNVLNYNMREARLGGNESFSSKIEDNYKIQETEQERSENKSILYCETFPIDGEKQIKIDTITNIGELELQILAKNSIAHEYYSSTILVIKDNYVLSDIPNLFSKNKKVNSALFWIRTKFNSLFRIKHEENLIFEKIVDSDEKINLDLEVYGKYSTELFNQGKIIDKYSKITSSIYLDKVFKTKLHLLKSGERIKGESLYVIPQCTMIISELVEALYRYPYGCAEQTLAAIFGNAMIYLHLDKLTDDYKKIYTQKEIFKRIHFGIRHINKIHNQFFENGFWGLYNYNQGTVEISIQCLLHLKPFLNPNLKKEFPEIQNWINKSVDQLLKNKIKDTRLFEFNINFLEKEINYSETASALILLDLDLENGIKYLELNFKYSKGGIYWFGKSMAGSLQTTIYAMRALQKVSHPLFFEAWKFVCSNMQNGLLYSTPDSAEFLSLILENNLFKSNQDAILNGSLKKITKEITNEKFNSIESIDSILLVRESFVENVNYLETKSTIQFKIENYREKIQNYSNQNILLKLNDLDSGAYVARVLVVGGVCFTSGNLRLQKKDFPFYGTELIIPIITFREGHSEVLIYLFDMYNSERVGVSNLIEFLVI